MASDTADYLQARATFLGSAALLEERYDLEQYGWFGDTQAFASLLAIQAAHITGIPDDAYSAHR